ncbi:Uncharacterised protein [uncultured archaeon]|nr:Uncharacterised protein [uncultured archaeon]
MNAQNGFFIHLTPKPATRSRYLLAKLKELFTPSRLTEADRFVLRNAGSLKYASPFENISLQSAEASKLSSADARDALLNKKYGYYEVQIEAIRRLDNLADVTAVLDAGVVHPTAKIGLQVRFQQLGGRKQASQTA